MSYKDLNELRKNAVLQCKTNENNEVSRFFPKLFSLKVISEVLFSDFFVH